MLMVVSPAKTLDFERPLPLLPHTQPELLGKSSELVDILSGKSPAELSALMGISDALARLNVGRYHDWQPPFDTGNARQAVFAFMGDVYEGLSVASLDDAEIAYLQDHLRILSGLYGVLRPLDLMQAYRLEMGTRLANPAGANLYAFWGAQIAQLLARELDGMGERTLVNLASEEYFKSVRRDALPYPVITPVFRDSKDGGPFKIVSFYAKRARGLMARWAAQHGVDDPQALKDFDVDGYRFDAARSGEHEWAFCRSHG